MIYLTSDFHFCHDKDFIYKERGFDSVEEMNSKIVENYNNIIKDDDIVYIVGDCMLNNDEEGIKLLKQLKGHKYLAIGNHDTDKRIKLYRENNIFEDIQMGYRIKYKSKTFIISHYPTMVDNTTKDNVFNLFGHTHQNNEYFYNRHLNMINIGVDKHKLKPISLDNVINIYNYYYNKHMCAF